MILPILDKYTVFNFDPRINLVFHRDNDGIHYLCFEFDIAGMAYNHVVTNHVKLMVIEEHELSLEEGVFKHFTYKKDLLPQYAIIGFNKFEQSVKWCGDNSGENDLWNFSIHYRSMSDITYGFHFKDEAMGLQFKLRWE